ncbi:hypothetical protein F972_01867 [Acinetobacter sp. CIP 102529]|uniref:hypothetical protein n=1 Tax=unclassified Acinetobacter TaxID=196816 RepID=UPI0002CE97A3|nr:MULTISPECIES: hypothetical protein [unclassified Acinetobacter]ENU83052.1 hypothetical protein F974_01884 [Acinetobacter sp. CIP 102159]ENU88776.1 hypothetical protein F972_01867 [Acinetobacter sp. CIP 102529]
MSENISLDDLNELIRNAEKKGKKIDKILLGYKAYYFFMSDSEFHKEVTSSALSPSKRKYKGHKIKVTQDDYQVELKIQEK